MNEREEAIQTRSGFTSAAFSGDVFAARTESALIGDRYHRALNEWTVGHGGRDAAIDCREIGSAYLESMNKLLEMLDGEEGIDDGANVTARVLELRELLKKELESIENYLELRD